MDLQYYLHILDYSHSKDIMWLLTITQWNAGSVGAVLLHFTYTLVHKHLTW